MSKYLQFAGFLFVSFLFNQFAAHAMDMGILSDKGPALEKDLENAAGPRRRSVSATAGLLPKMRLARPKSSQIQLQPETTLVEEASEARDVPEPMLKSRFWAEKRTSAKPRPRSHSDTLRALEDLPNSVSRRYATRTLIETPEDIVDKKYLTFLRKCPGFGHVEEASFFYQDPLGELFKIVKAEQDIHLKQGFVPESFPTGRYARRQEISFCIRKFDKEVTYPVPKQGWKIHVSAHPQSAQKIAALVMGVIDRDIALANKRNSEKKIEYTYFKISSSIPCMRTQYYIIGNLEGDGRETQAGKFITIYPANKKHAAAIAKSIDDVFMSALRGEILQESDFYPLRGEALVGQSGGVYVRYGNLTSAMDVIRPGKYHKPKYLVPELPPEKRKNKRALPLQEDSASIEASHVELIETLIPDDRSHPWPDWMNKGGDGWNDARDPFPGLNMRWIRGPGKEPITWPERPYSWKHVG